MTPGSKVQTCTLSYIIVQHPVTDRNGKRCTLVSGNEHWNAFFWMCMQYGHPISTYSCTKTPYSRSLRMIQIRMCDLFQLFPIRIKICFQLTKVWKVDLVCECCCIFRFSYTISVFVCFFPLSFFCSFMVWISWESLVADDADVEFIMSIILAMILYSPWIFGKANIQNCEVYDWLAGYQFCAEIVPYRPVRLKKNYRPWTSMYGVRRYRRHHQYALLTWKEKHNN